MTTKPSQEDVAALVRRLYLATGTTGPAELARALGLSDRSVVSNWMRRGTVPLSECLRLAEQQGLSLDWMLAGWGPMRRGKGEDYPMREDRPERPEDWLEAIKEAAAHYQAGAGRERMMAAAWMMSLDEQKDLQLLGGAQWLATWWPLASEDDRAWLLGQLRRAVPDYADWLSRASGSQVQSGPADPAAGDDWWPVMGDPPDP